MSSRLERLRERRRRRRIRARIITASLGAGALAAGVIAYAGPFGKAAGQAMGRPAPVVTPQVVIGELTAAAAGSPVKAGTGTDPAPAGAAREDPGGTEAAKQEKKAENPKAPAGKTDPKSREKAAIKASGPSEYTDERAVAYFTSRWQDEATERITDIRTVGRYLRIYTSLPESADNSRTALTLCERGLEYLTELGESDPVVFVQAKYGDNGNPVLANVLGPEDDDCRVTHPEPR